MSDRHYSSHSHPTGTQASDRAYSSRNGLPYQSSTQTAVPRSSHHPSYDYHQSPDPYERQANSTGAAAVPSHSPHNSTRPRMGSLSSPVAPIGAYNSSARQPSYPPPHGMHDYPHGRGHAYSHPPPPPPMRGMDGAPPSGYVSKYGAGTSPSDYGYDQDNEHNRYPASPQRPFGCDLCPLSFNRQHDLKRHRETHSGERPFLCNGPCGKSFTRKDALKRHQVSFTIEA